MYIKKVLVLSLFLCLAISAAYASNIGRHVYGAYAESISGPNFDDNLHIDESVRMFAWGTLKTSSRTVSPAEGLIYTRCSVNGSTWGGGGVTFVNSSNEATTRNMSAYYGGKLKFLVKINSANCKNIPVGIKVGGNEVCFPLSNSTVFSGFDSTKLNQWQEVSMNLNSTTDSRITSANMAETSYLFLITYGNDVVSSGLLLDFDYVRWIKSGSGSFNVTVKKVSDSSTVSTSNITWASSTFQTDWKVAEQYLEINYDKDSSTNNWNVKLFVNNGSKDRNGLYAIKSGREYVLPMCWRATTEALPYSDYYGYHSYQIAEGEATGSQGKYKYLYDSGSSSTTNPVWLYMQDLGSLETDEKKDYSTVMGYKTGGYHVRSGVYGGGPGNNGYESGSKVCLYLGANCKNAVGGLKYQGNILVVLEYE